MPADLVPREAIAQLAAQIDAPAAYWVLQYLQKAGFIMNDTELDDRMADILERLTALGLVDPGHAGPGDGKPYLWTMNANGTRVLKHIETSPPRRDALQPRFRITDRARTALVSISDQDQLKALLAVEALRTAPPDSWPKDEVLRLDEDKPVYLLRVTPELRTFIRVLDSGEIEVFDLAQEETLRLFLERQRAAGAHP